MTSGTSWYSGSSLHAESSWDRVALTEDSHEDDSMGGDVVLYDEIDSSKTIDEKVEALILQKPSHLPTEKTDAESDHND